MSNERCLKAAACGLLVALGLVAAPAHAQRLMEFYRSALEGNPALRTSELGVEQAEAQKDVELSKLLPQASLSGSYAWNKAGDNSIGRKNYNSVRSGLQVQQSLFDLPAHYRYLGAVSSMAQSEQLRQAARVKLAGDVVDRYLVALQAADEAANLESEKATVDTQQQRLRVMRELQMAKVTDLYEAQAYYQGVLTREIEARNLLAVAQARLRELTGLASERLPPLERESFEPVPGLDDDWVKEAEQANPQLQALRQAIEVAELDVRSGRAENLPKVLLTLSQTHSDQGYDNRLSPATTVGSFGVQVTIPLYEGGRVDASLKGAAARLAVARERYETARREMERDVRTAYLNASTHLARIVSTRDEVEALTQVVESQRTSQELGVSTLVDVLNAERRLFKARSDQLKARYDFIRAWTTLRVMAGRLGERDLEEIDSWMVSAESPS